jgi:hypothetical protein
MRDQFLDSSKNRSGRKEFKEFEEFKKYKEFKEFKNKGRRTRAASPYVDARGPLTRATFLNSSNSSLLPLNYP